MSTTRNILNSLKIGVPAGLAGSVMVAAIAEIGCSVSKCTPMDTSTRSLILLASNAPVFIACFSCLFFGASKNKQLPNDSYNIEIGKRCLASY